MHSSHNDDLESLKMREKNIMTERNGFLKYASITIIVIIIIAITKSDPSEELSTSFLGGLTLPRSLILEQIFIVKSFLFILLSTSFIGWILAIIDINRHPMYNYYRGQKSFVVKIADFWDNISKIKFMSLQNLLDFIQKILFLTLVVFLLVQLLLV